MGGLWSLTCISFVMCLVSGTLYSWAAYSIDLQSHFSWSLHEMTAVQTTAFVGKVVPSFTIGLIIGGWGSLTATLYCTAVASTSYLLIYLAVMHMWSPPAMLAVLFAFMGHGSVGYYYLALYNVGKTWPVEKVGRIMGIMACGHALSGGAFAKVYAHFGSPARYLLCMTVTMFAVGIMGFVAQTYCSTEETTLSEEDAKGGMEEKDRKTPAMAREASSDYGSLSIPKANRRSSWHPTSLTAPTIPFCRSASDTVLVTPRKVDPINVIWGAPLMLEEKGQLQQMEVTDIIKTLEFWMMAATLSLSCANMLLLNFNLGLVSAQIGTSWNRADLVIFFSCADGIARFGLGWLSDATMKTKYFERSFYFVISNTAMLFDSGILVAGPRSINTLLLTCVVGGFAYGGSLSLTPIFIRHVFGVDHIAVIMGLLVSSLGLGVTLFQIFFVLLLEDANRSYLTSFGHALGVSCSVSLPMAIFVWKRAVQSSDL